MTDFNSTVLARGTGTFGTFVVTEGVVKKGANILVTFFGDKTVLVTTAARSTFTVPAEHGLFDGLMFALMTAGIAIEYVDNVRTFLNPKMRYEAFLKMSDDDAAAFNTKFDIKLNEQELAVVATLKRVQAKIGKQFKLPGGASGLGAELTDEMIKEAFPNDSERARVTRWLKGDGGVGYDIERQAKNDSTGKKNLLRITGTGTRRRIETVGDHAMTIAAFQRGLTMINAHLDAGRGDGRIGSLRVGSYASHYLSIGSEGKTLSIGCQTVLMSEVMRIAALLEG